MSDLKFCNLCKQTKHILEFNSRFYKVCKECANKKAKEWREKNHDKSILWHRTHRRRSYLKWKFGITKEGFENLSKVCEICGSEEKLQADHDHQTGEFRGILCSSCNIGLGRLGDNVESIKKTLLYLEQALSKQSKVS